MSDSWYLKATIIAMTAIFAGFLVAIYVERRRWKRSRTSRGALGDLAPLTMDGAERLYREATPRPFTEEEIERMVRKTVETTPESPLKMSTPAQSLLPCPFCGETPISSWPDANTACMNSKCPIYRTPINPALWNTRPAQAQKGTP